jgi:ABC-type transport system substrate-binding protein
VVIGTQEFTQLETRQTLPGLGYALMGNETIFLSSEIGTPANHWSGGNRSGWISPEYDRLWNAANSTLDPIERGRDVAQMMALVSENLPGYALYFLISIRTRVAALQGPDDEAQSAGFGSISKAPTAYWNIQDWQFR